jgi:hypothetical protein
MNRLRRNPDSESTRRSNGTHQLRRARYQKKLRELLASAEEQGLMWLVWAACALRDGKPELAARILKDPPAEPWDFGPRLGPIPPWHLETLVNERFLAPPYPPPPRRNGFVKVLNTDRFAALKQLASLLHAWEEAESGIVLGRLDVLKEMPRLTHRQFEWQRGPAYYRWAFIYGGPLANAHFQSKAHGLTTADFLFYGFAAHAIYGNRPVWRRHQWIQNLGIDRDVSEKALALLIQTPQAARRLAKELRNAPGGPAYQRSVLRVAPIISFNDGDALVAPIPDLISARVTSGLFYDHADAPSDVRNEAGARFEVYVRDLLAGALLGLNTTLGKPYQRSGQAVDPPDVLSEYDGRLAAVFECKARKMSFDARFSETSETDPGHQELAKGVFQLWRFFAHHRHGILTTEPKPDPETSAVLVTLDNWMQMSSDRQQQVLTMAKALAARKDPLIEAQDQRTIVFCSIEDLETTLQRCDEPRFLRDLAAASEERFTGWMLPNIYLSDDDGFDKPYPLIDRMSEVLPWWNRFGHDDEHRDVPPG